MANRNLILAVAALFVVAAVGLTFWKVNQETNVNNEIAGKALLETANKNAERALPTLGDVNPDSAVLDLSQISDREENIVLEENGDFAQYKSDSQSINDYGEIYDSKEF